MNLSLESSTLGKNTPPTEIPMRKRGASKSVANHSTTEDPSTETANKGWRKWQQSSTKVNCLQNDNGHQQKWIVYPGKWKRSSTKVDCLQNDNSHQQKWIVYKMTTVINKSGLSIQANNTTLQERQLQMEGPCQPHWLQDTQLTEKRV